MGKLLSLGSRLRYPIVVNKLLTSPNDEIKKKQPLFRYTFTWMKTVGDSLHDEEWEEEQTTYADWDSPSEGRLVEWKIHEGQTISSDMPFVEVAETCPHSIQFAGLCGMCGKDMTDVSWASASTDTERAKINMIHDQTSLTVSTETASKAEVELQRRLLTDRKLSLVVDLDQTIIHACVESTIGDWMSDPNSPNYEAVQDVKRFQLEDGAPRGLASDAWYYIKMRPGLKEFLERVSQLYELHVYTMGTRAYALGIAKIIDPDKKLFGDRIISRDENGSWTQKRLERLFPVDTKMVVIIDDRADVWPYNRTNLIKVNPFDFWKGTGDINSSFLPKREELARVEVVEVVEEKKIAPTEIAETPSGEVQIPAEDAPPGGEALESEGKSELSESRVSPLAELAIMGGADNEALRQEQVVEQERYLEKQLMDRPLLHMQEQLDEKEKEEEQASPEKNGNTAEHPSHKESLLKDDDVELKYLVEHLVRVHKAFYDEYNSSMVSAQGGRVAQLKPGHTKKIPIKEESGDLQIVPDIGEVMPSLKYVLSTSHFIFVNAS
jgi:RNA polymerase II subunit A-like phosphatase